MDAGGPGVAPLGQQLIDAAKQGTIERVGADFFSFTGLRDRDFLRRVSFRAESI